ncbi:MAG: YibE/F family protein [Clostridiales Family XIII bacterium]|jgi:uncharacterized membrane protein|nr:YibE/F family protein [Clostridiales Family XIII bacterium]
MRTDTLRTGTARKVKTPVGEILTFAAVAALTVIFLITGARAITGFVSVADPNLRYYKAVVTETDDSLLALPDYGGEREFGLQIVNLRLTEGPFEGRNTVARNSVMPDSYVKPSVGDEMIVSVDVRDNGEIYTMLISHYRVPGLLFAIAVFVLLLIVTCKGKGLRALFGLVFTLVTIFFFTIPRIYEGDSPVFCAIFTSMLTAGVSLLLLNGYTKKTLASVLATFAGFCAAGLIFGVFSALSNLSGYNAQQLGMLSYFAANSGMRLKYLLFAGVLIASIGAVMDVSMSVASAVYEVRTADASLGVNALFKSGMEVAKDAIGTMSNTLILAFTGGALANLMALMGYGIQFNRFINSNYIALEIGQGLSASAALIVTAPLTSLFAAVIYSGRFVKRDVR